MRVLYDFVWSLLLHNKSFHSVWWYNLIVIFSLRDTTNKQTNKERRWRCVTYQRTTTTKKYTNSFVERPYKTKVFLRLVWITSWGVGFSYKWMKRKVLWEWTNNSTHTHTHTLIEVQLRRWAIQTSNLTSTPSTGIQILSLLCLHPFQISSVNALK